MKCCKYEFVAGFRKHSYDGERRKKFCWEIMFSINYFNLYFVSAVAKTSSLSKFFSDSSIIKSTILYRIIAL